MSSFCIATSLFKDKRYIIVSSYRGLHVLLYEKVVPFALVAYT